MYSLVTLMTPFTKQDRRAGHKAMEKVLTPMQRALRKFGSGKPPETPKNTPLGAVILATEQRARLFRLLNDPEDPVKGAKITSMAVVVRRVPFRPDAPADTVLIREG